MLARTKIIINGLNLHKVPTIMLTGNIKTYELMRYEKSLEFFVSVFNKAKAIKLLNKKGYTNLIVNDIGIATFLTKQKLPLIICLSFICCIIFLASSLVWRIEINGNTIINDSEVVTVLNQYGINYLKPKGNISLDKLENYICNNLSMVDFASVQVIGSSIIINIKEKDIAPPIIDYNKKSDIIATADGVITRLYVVSGTCAFKVGDTVKKGQVLIKGQRTFVDGKTEDVRAVGEVYASISNECIEEIPLVSQVKVPTGKKFKRTNIVLFNKTYSSFVKNPYQNFISSKRLFNLNIFGLTFETEEVLEVSISDKQINMDEEKPFLKEKAVNKAKESIAFDKIDKIDCVFETSNTMLRAKVILYGQIKISKNV